MSLMLKRRMTGDILKQTENIETENLRKSHLKNDRGESIEKAGNSKKTDNLFVERNSHLTDLLEIPHNRTIYNIFVGMTIILFLNSLILDVVEHGRIDLGTDLIRSVFAKMDLVIIVWGVMQLVALLPYWFLKWWTVMRFAIYKHSKIRKFWDIFWLTSYIVFQFSFLSALFCTSERIIFPVVSSIIIMFEMLRFVMKIHSYVRTVSPRVLNSTSESSIPYPAFSSYLYYLFAPTMFYRDSYPRTEKIRWGFACERLLEMFAIIWLMSLLVVRLVSPHWSSFGTPNQVIEAGQFVTSVFSTMLPGILLLVCGLHVILHSWLNFTSEVLTFADRQFYLDWWNQSSYGAHFRTSNIVIQKWLQIHILKDIFLLTGNRVFSSVAVFVLSAAVHELVLMYAFGFFYPVQFTLFVFLGMMFAMFVKNMSHSTGNIFLLTTLTIGNGLLWSLYSMEYYARNNCPLIKGDGRFVLYSWSQACHNIVWKLDWQF